MPLQDTTLEEGVLISRKLLTKMMEDIAELRSRVGISDQTKEKKQKSFREKYTRTPYKITGSTTSGGRIKYTGLLLLFAASEGAEKGYIVHPDNITRSSIYSDADAMSNTGASEVPVGTVVWVYEVVVKGATTDQVEYRFSPGSGGGELPTGEYQFMVWQMTSDNQGGWDFVRAHPV